MAEQTQSTRKPRASKEEAFKANAARIVKEITFKMGQLGALAQRQAHTKEQVEKIFKHLDKSLNEAHERFENPTKAQGDEFSL